MNIYPDDTDILKIYKDKNWLIFEPDLHRAQVVAKASANHAVKEVFDYLNVKDLKVMINRLLEVGLMIKEIDNE